MSSQSVCMALLLLANVAQPALAGTSMDIGTRSACFIDANSKISCSGRDSSGQLGNGAGNTPTNLPMPVSGGLTASSLAMGAEHVCALTPLGEAYCWGSDSAGQLGSSLMGDQQQPVKVETGQIGAVKFASVSAGGDSTCVADDQGRAFCWGKAVISDPGAGAQSNQPLPKQIVLPTNQVTSVAVGIDHACALSSTGTAWCWGKNDSGQLGNGQTNAQAQIPSAVLMPPGVRFVAISLGDVHTCALAQTGSAWCWGRGIDGQLGNGSEVDVSTPSMVTPPSPNTSFTKVSTGGIHACAIDSLGSLWCWGAGFSGALGIGGPRRNSSVPAHVPFTANQRVDSVVAGPDATCAVTTAGNLYCWGDGDNQRLGWGFDAWRPDLMGVPGASDTLKIGSGKNHVCAFDIVHSLECWGANEHGQLGNGSFDDSGDAVAVNKATMPAGIQVSLIDGGDNHTCVLSDAGKIWCWGDNSSGQLGIGISGVPIPTPQPVDQSSGQLFKGLAVGANHTCAIDFPGNVWCWGKNGSGELGTGDTIAHSAPVMADAGGKTFVTIAAGNGFTCAVEDAVGTVYCWGFNNSGQLGLNDTTNRLKPTLLTYLGFSGFLQIAAGDGHVCAGQKVNGDNVKSRLWCWGYNQFGQIGNGTTVNALQPTINGFVDGADSQLRPGYIGMGANHSCVRRSSSLVECWGNNVYGQLADGTNSPRISPVTSQFSFNDQLVAGWNHTCSVGSSGIVGCSGWRAVGQLGDGLVSSPEAPTQVAGFTPRVDQMLRDGFE